MKKVIALLLGLSMSLSLVACSGQETSKTSTTSTTETTKSTEAGSGDSQETIKIAAFYNLSGANAEVGLQDRQGTDLAVEHINNNGGIKSLGGRKLEIVYGDTLSDVSQVKAVTERVLSDDSIVAAIGVGGSAYAAPQLPIMEKLNVAYVMHGTAASLTEQGYKTIFRPVTMGGDKGEFGKTQVQFLQYLNENYNMDTKKVAIIYENSDYGISVAKGNKALIEQAGLELVYEESYPIGLSDASSLVVAMKNSGAQAIFPASFPQEAKLIFNTMKSMNYNPVIVGGGAGFLFPSFADSLGDSVEGVTSVTSLAYSGKHIVDNPELQAIVTEYKDRFGTFMSEHATTSYDNVLIVADALERAGKVDRAAVRDAIAETNLETLQPLGPVVFNEVGHNINAKASIVQWQKQEDGTFGLITIYPEELATGEYRP